MRDTSDSRTLPLALSFTHVREVKFVHLGLPEARYYLGCRGHMHVFRRVGYRSGSFIEDARIGVST